MEETSDPFRDQTMAALECYELATGSTDPWFVVSVRRGAWRA